MAFLATILIIAVVCSIVLIAPMQAEVDCKNKIKDMKLKDCCRVPEPYFNDFYSSCTRGIMLGPCGYNCLFNSTNTLENNKLNMINLRATLNKMYNNSALFVDAYALAYEKCEPIILDRVEKYEKKAKRFPLTGLCSPMSMGLKVCAHKYMFASCPAAAWTASAECEEMKEYMKVCSERGGKRNGEKFPKTQSTKQNAGLATQSTQTNGSERTSSKTRNKPNRSTNTTNAAASKGQRGNGRKRSQQSADGQKGQTSNTNGSTAGQTTARRRRTTSNPKGSTVVQNAAALNA